MYDLVRILQKIHNLWNYLYGRIILICMPVLSLLITGPDVFDEELWLNSVNDL